VNFLVVLKRENSNDGTSDAGLHFYSTDKGPKFLAATWQVLETSLSNIATNAQWTYGNIEG